MSSETSLSYEDAFSKLEVILERLEGGDLPLEESLQLYEEGAALAQVCTTLLDNAELRVRQWQPGNGMEEIEDWADES